MTWLNDGEAGQQAVEPDGAYAPQVNAKPFAHEER